MNGILLVEDEEHLARGLKFNLEAEGYPTKVVGDGETAVSYTHLPGDRRYLAAVISLSQW